MSVAVAQNLAEIYLRFAAKIGVIADADAEREMPHHQGKDTTAVGKALVDKGVLHPNNFKLLESMFARQLTRMTHAVHAISIDDAAKDGLKSTPKIESATASDAVFANERQGFGLMKGDTTKLKGSAQATTRYKIVRPLSSTRLSELFVAEDVELHREVVLKRLSAKHQRAPGYRIRFNRTAEVTSGLEHPCIPPIYNHGLDSDGRPYYTTRYLTGESLADSIARTRAADPADPPRALDRKSPAESLRLYVQRLLQVCDALSFAHSRGVMHCGMAPDRILLGRHGETLVVGWGRSELIYGRRAKSSSSGAKAPPPERSKDPAKGSRPPREASQSRRENPSPYTSPEQLTGGPAAAGILSDVYGLGAVLYFIVTARAPFTAPAEELPAAIEQGLKPNALYLVEETSTRLARICAKAMDLDPMKRQASVREFAAEIEVWLNENAPQITDPESPALATKATKSRFLAKHRRSASILAAACVLSGLSGVLIGGFGKRSMSAAATAPSLENPQPAESAFGPWDSLLAAAPEIFESLATSIEKTPRLLPLRHAGLAGSLLQSAETALSHQDDAKAARRLKEVEPLLVAMDPASANEARQRWASAVGKLADRAPNSEAATASLRGALAVTESRRREDDESWSSSRLTLAHRLAGIEARQGRFAEAVRLSEGRSPKAPNDEPALRFAVERAEWLGFADRHPEAANEFKRIAERLTEQLSSQPADAATQRLLARALIGAAEQQLALEKSAATAIDEAANALAKCSGSDLETTLLRARLDGVSGTWLLHTGKPKEALTALAKATEGWTKATGKNDADASTLLWASAAWDSLRQLHSNENHSKESLAAADRTTALLERVAAKETVAERLGAVDSERGVLLVGLGKLNDAEAAFSRVVERGGLATVNARYLRSACRIEQKNFAEARGDAEELAKGKDAASRYLAARIFGRLSGVAVASTNAAVQEDGGHAMTLLQGLAKERFFSGERANLPSADPELDALRQRPDFKELFAPKPVAKATANPSAATPSL